MANRMQRWVEERNRKLQQFTHDELHVEILRQKIQELETQTLEASAFSMLEDLKLELAAFQERADITTQGRIHSNRLLELMREFQTSTSTPTDAERTLKDYLSWLEAMEDHRKKDYLSYRNHILEQMPIASWAYRGQLLRWYGKEVFHRLARQKIPYYISRVSMGQVLRLVRKG